MPRAPSYHLLSCIGRGGFGEVYLAKVQRPGGLERKRALKLLRADLERPDEAVARLRDEGRLLALLEHPAIVQVEDIVRIEGRIGLLMEYVEGTDLRRLLKAGHALPTTVVLEVVGTVADALASAVALHSPTTGRPLRLVHRDIKPGNVMLSAYGRVKLLDFGVARTRELERDTRTRIGEVPMTPGYVGPEVLLRQVQEPPGDVFALGVVTYRCLAHQKLFRGLKLTEQVALLSDPRGYHDWLADRVALLEHRSLRDLVADMLAWSPEERPPAHVVRERAEQLQADLDGPSLARWIRRLELPPAPDLPDAELVGQTLYEQDMEPGPRHPVRNSPTLVAPETLSDEARSPSPLLRGPAADTDLSELHRAETPPIAAAIRPNTLVDDDEPREGGGSGPVVLAVVGIVFTLGVLVVLALAAVAAFYML